MTDSLGSWEELSLLLNKFERLCQSGRNPTHIPNISEMPHSGLLVIFYSAMIT